METTKAILHKIRYDTSASCKHFVGAIIILSFVLVNLFCQFPTISFSYRPAPSFLLLPFKPPTRKTRQCKQDESKRAPIRRLYTVQFGSMNGGIVVWMSNRKKRPDVNLTVNLILTNYDCFYGKGRFCLNQISYFDIFFVERVMTEYQRQKISSLITEWKMYCAVYLVVKYYVFSWNTTRMLISSAWVDRNKSIINFWTFTNMIIW